MLSILLVKTNFTDKKYLRMNQTSTRNTWSSTMNFFTKILLALFFTYTTDTHASPDDPLSTWQETPVKSSIIDFVEQSTAVESDKFIPVAERIAVFDNDGTLWSEQPFYFQLAFAIDRIKALAPLHPEWKKQEPFRSLLNSDLKNVLAGGEHAILEIIAASHSGITTDEFSQLVHTWLQTATHPKTGTLYTKMVYQPMLELLTYLRSKGYKTYIVTGGGIDFVRAFSETVYGIPPEQVIGSSGKIAYEVRNGTPALMKRPGVHFIDDKAGKPVGIQYQIGRRPVIAFGNSDGDFEMLEWTTSSTKPSLGALIVHDDAVREWSYDRNSPIGKLDRGLTEAPKRGWLLCTMKSSWKTIFASSLMPTDPIPEVP